ncbi:MAG: CD225/dispanin family protein [Prevotella sp.]|nr:CD225/dispanin family protein [Prevotella sp.]
MDYQYQTVYSDNSNNVPVMPDNHKTMTIVALALSVLCCNVAALGLSIYALMQANEVETSMQQGFPMKAEAAAKNAKLFSYIALGLEAFTAVIMVFYFAFLIIASIASY